jgi:hypothetical protein
MKKIPSLIPSLANLSPFVIPFRQLAEGHGIHVFLTNMDTGSLSGMTKRGDFMRSG